MSRWVFLLCAAVLAGRCAAQPVLPDVGGASARAVQWPATPLTADVLYRLLAAEMAAQRGQTDFAVRTLLELARTTQDPRLAQRAFQFAVLGHDTARAYAAARQWSALVPQSQEAAQYVLEYGLAVDPQAALSATHHFLKNQPQARQLHLQLIEQLATRGALDDALTHVQQLRQQTPEDFDLLYVQAQVHVQAENYDQARALLEEYIQVQSQRRQAIVQDNASDAHASLADAQLLLAHIAEQQGKLEEAIAVLAQIDDVTVQFQSRLRRAVLQARQGRVQQARETLESLVPRDARERSAVASTLAFVYRESGRTDDAVQVLEEALREQPDALPVRYDLAMLYERQGRPEALEAQLQYILSIDPDHVNANNALGYTLADQNRRLDEAQILLERAEQLEPDNPYILDSVGWYHYRRGDLARALGYLRRAWDAMPAGDVAAHLGEVLWMMQRRDDAQAIWQEGLRLEAQNETLHATLRRLGVVLP